MLKYGIETHGGKTNPHILLIAPHGYPDPDNDENTGALVRSIQKLLDCSAIINEFYRKPKLLKKKPKKVYEEYSLENRILNLNYRPQAEEFPYYIEQIQQNIKNPASTIVVWIHGIDDKNIKDESRELLLKERLQCLIGYGQPDHETCSNELKDIVLRVLNSAGIKSAHTRDDALNYRGFEDWNMNRWFKVSGKGLEAVQSIQLELGYAGVRDPDSIEKTAKKFADALISLNGTMNVFPVEDKPDEKLVSETYEYLHEVVQPHFHKAMLAAGTHIIKNFFDGDFERAKNPRNATKIHSFNELTRRLQGTDGHGPSKTWVYNAIKLAVDQNQFKRFSVYGKLGLSHKVYLTHVKDLETKRQLIQEAVENNYTVAQTRERIAEVQGSDPHETFSFDSIPSDDDLEKVGRDELLRRKKVVLSRFEFYKNKMEHFHKYQDSITRVLKTIASKRGTPIGKVIELPTKEATEPAQQNQKREQGIV